MDISECKNYHEIAQVLGYNYYNGRIKQKILKYCEIHNLNPEILFNNNKKNTKCLFCGKEIKSKNKFIKKFCNSSCAASFNNKRRKLSNETKNKIRNSLLKYKKNETTHKLSYLIDNNIILNPLNVEYKNINVPYSKYKKKKCIICGNEFKPFLTKNGFLSKKKTCSTECHYLLRSFNGKKTMERLIAEKKHIGWESRNIISYPEQFWMKVLENNNINYKHNFFIKKYRYFLDFFITIEDKKIDLEIDGKQHKYKDRVEHDKQRDINLKNEGYIVYRVDWNTINTNEGRQKMENKINNFLIFIENIKNELKSQ